MKAECNLEKIKNAVAKVEKITGKNLTLPVLSTILVVAQGKMIKFKAMNLSLGIEVDIPAKVDKEGVLAIPGAVLNNTLTNLFDSDNVHLEEQDGNLVIKTKRNNLKIKGVPYEDFPTIPRVEGVVFDIEPKKIIDGIKSVYFSASPSDIKPEISSVYIYSNEDELVFVSTDSFRLAEKKIKIKNPPEILGILIPFKNISEIIRVLSEVNGDLNVCFNKNQISFTAEGLYLTSRIIDGVFPDYRQIMPTNFSTEVTLLKQDLINSLKITNIFSDKFNQITVLISPKEKKFEFYSNNNDVGENRTSINSAISGEDIELSFNYKYLQDATPSISSDSITLKFNGQTRPIVLTPVSDKSFTYLIMPMNR